MSMLCAYDKCPIKGKVINILDAHAVIPSRNPEIPDAYFHAECYDSVVREERGRLQMQTYDGQIHEA